MEDEDDLITFTTFLPGLILPSSHVHARTPMSSLLSHDIYHILCDGFSHTHAERTPAHLYNFDQRQSCVISGHDVMRLLYCTGPSGLFLFHKYYHLHYHHHHQHHRCRHHHPHHHHHHEEASRPWKRSRRVTEEEEGRGLRRHEVAFND